MSHQISQWFAEEGRTPLLEEKDFSRLFRFYEILSDIETDFPETTINTLSDLFHITKVSYTVFEKSRLGNRYVSEIYGFFPEEQLNLYRTHYYLYDPFFQNFPSLNASDQQQDVYTSSLFGDALFQSSEYGKFLRNYKVGYQAILGGGHIDARDTTSKWPRHILSVYKEVGEGPFTDRELALYGYIGRAFAHCIRNYKRKLRQRHLSKALDEFLDHQELGFAILDADAKPLRYNSEFMNLGLQISGERNGTAKGILENLFSLLQLDRPSNSSDSPPPPVYTAEKNNILIRAERTNLEIENSVHFMTFLRLERKTPSAPERTMYKLISRYDLTQRESQIAGCVLQKMPNAEIQEKFHISMSTVKSHLRSIYSKLGINSRQELIALYRKLADED